MTTVQQANLWQDGRACRKVRTPKIGDIPRHSALDVDVIKPPKENDVIPTTPTFQIAAQVPPSFSPTILTDVRRSTYETSRSSACPAEVTRLLVDPARARAGIARKPIEAIRSRPNDAVEVVASKSRDTETLEDTRTCVEGRTSKNDDVRSDGDRSTGSNEVTRDVTDKCRLDDVVEKPVLPPVAVRKTNSVIENNAVPSQKCSLQVESLNPKVLLHAKSLGGTNDNGRPIFPNCPYSPYNSPTNSPRSSRKKPLRESRRVSIEKLGTYLQLNQYKLMDAIGQGSYGIVKLAYNEEDDTHYAMKILSKRKLFKKSGMFGRLPPRKEGRSNSSPISHPLAKVYREIAILKKLDHPNIVKLVEVLDDPDEDHLYLAFELLDRGQVLEIPTSEPLDEDKAWRYFRDVVLGIEYLHFQRIIHRDIKPANLLLDDSDRVQITDFGVCNEFHGADAFLSNTAGTPAFMPPEALGEDRAAGFSGKCTDIWSMGVTLFALVYGHVPFYDDNIVGLYSKIRHQEVEFPETPAVSKELKDLVQKMLVKDPGKRITLPEIKVHPWTTKHGLYPLPSEEENCHLVEVTDEDVARVITSIPKLDTLILIKHMLKKHSFQNPFLHRRDTTIGAPAESANTGPTAARQHIGRSGRSNSAPDTYNWMQHKQVSVDSPLESVTEVNLDQYGPEEDITGAIKKVIERTTRVCRKFTEQTNSYTGDSRSDKTALKSKLTENPIHTGDGSQVSVSEKSTKPAQKVISAQTMLEIGKNVSQFRGVDLNCTTGRVQKVIPAQTTRGYQKEVFQYTGDVQNDDENIIMICDDDQMVIVRSESRNVVEKR